MTAWNARRSRRWIAKSLAAIACALPVVAAALSVGCAKKAPPEVVVYTALDQEFSQPIFDDFTKSTGIVVRPKFDTESTKTIGLVQAILAERERPRCDLFWNNEILNTIRLDREGLLRAYASPAAANYPPGDRSPENKWFGFAARARVLIVNTNQVAEARRPKSIQDLTDAQWYDRVAVAKPLFGTTATQAACLFSVWGDAKAEEYFRALKRNARIMSGNKQVALAVANGEMAFGLTDTDDAIVEIEAGKPVAIIYPDQGEGELGTLFIPNTLALIHGSEHVEAAEKLLNFLLSPEVEQRLAYGPSAQIPLQSGVIGSDRVKGPLQVRAMDVDFSAAADKWQTTAKFLQAEFTGAE